jgi:hypothetical protein
MPNRIAPNPVVTSTSSSKTAADYQSEALAALSSAGGDQTQTTPPPAQAGAEKAQGKDDGGATALEPKDEASATEPEKKAPSEGDDIPKGIKAAFEKLTADKAAFRQEREGLVQKLKDAEERAAKAEGLAGAKSPMELLRAAGYSWKDAVEEMTGLRPEGEEGEPAVKPGKATESKKLTLEDIDPEAAADLREFRRQRQEAEAKAGREKVSSKLKEFAEKAGDKFKFTAKLGEYDKALDFINAHFAKHKALPGATPEEAMEIALAHVEADLRKEAEKWRGLLTPGQEGGTQESADEAVRESAVPQAESDRAVSIKTLTNSLGGRTTNNSKQPSTPEEYRAAALAEMMKAERR